MGVSGGQEGDQLRRFENIGARRFFCAAALQYKCENNKIALHDD
jgi:hypothetical protein